MITRMFVGFSFDCYWNSSISRPELYLRYYLTTHLMELLFNSLTKLDLNRHLYTNKRKKCRDLILPLSYYKSFFVVRSCPLVNCFEACLQKVKLDFFSTSRLL